MPVQCQYNSSMILVQYLYSVSTITVIYQYRSSTVPVGCQHNVDTSCCQYNVSKLPFCCVPIQMSDSLCLQFVSAVYCSSVQIPALYSTVQYSGLGHNTCQYNCHGERSTWRGWVSRISAWGRSLPYLGEASRRKHLLQ